MKILPGNASAERQAHLMAYAIAWLQDNARSKAALHQKRPVIQNPAC